MWKKGWLTVTLVFGLVALSFALFSRVHAQQNWIWERLPGFAASVQDQSADRSALEFSGPVMLWEEPLQEGLLSAYAPDFQAQNVSGKTILAFVVDWELTGSWGQGVTSGSRLEDCFFADDVILPNGFISFRVPPHRQSTAPSFNTLANRTVPAALTYARYIQFTDGTELGDRNHGDELFRVRNQIWRHLRSLDRVYRLGGEEPFVQELNDTIEPWGADYFFASIRKTQMEQGAEAAIQQVRIGLAWAREHQRALDE